MATQNTKPKIWVLPWGLYPRRVTIYLAEKGIADKFDVIPVDITANGLEKEGKPQGTVPILEIEPPASGRPGRYIFQSTAILEYLEDAYGAEGPDMRGPTPEARARVRECTDMLNEATTWLVLYVKHGSSLYAARQNQDVGAARAGLEQMHKALSLLEKLADADGPFLVGQSPMTVDCILAATVQFAQTVYGIDMLGKHPRLEKTVRAMEGRGTAVMPELPDMPGLKDNVMHVK